MAKNEIASVVTTGVVDAFEVIDVDARNAQWTGIALGELPLFFEADHGVAAIKDAGEFVGDGQAFEAAVDGGELGVEGLGPAAQADQLVVNLGSSDSGADAGKKFSASKGLPTKSSTPAW